MTINIDLTLSDLVTADPGRTRVMERLGLNYCCDGDDTLREACAAVGIDPAEAAKALEAAPPALPVDWEGISLEDITTHIVGRHHAYLWRELPRVSVLLAKATRAHGEAHPELFELGKTFESLRAGLEPHLLEEERVLFPAINALEAGMDAAPFAQKPVQAMRDEHAAVGDLLTRLRTLSDDYTPPQDACVTYRALMAGLDDLEHALHVHIHLETHELFPRALELTHPQPTTTP